MKSPKFHFPALKAGRENLISNRTVFCLFNVLVTVVIQLINSGRCTKLKARFQLQFLILIIFSIEKLLRYVIVKRITVVVSLVVKNRLPLRTL